MASTRVPTTVITWNEQFSSSHVGVRENMEAVTQKIKSEVAQRVFDAVKLWEDTRTVHIGGLTAQVHDHGYERIPEIVAVNITSQKIKKTGGKWGKPNRWEWSGQGTCAIEVKSFAEEAPA